MVTWVRMDLQVPYSYKQSDYTCRYYMGVHTMCSFQGQRKIRVSVDIKLIGAGNHHYIIFLNYMKNNKILLTIRCPARPKLPQIYMTAILSNTQFNILPKS